MKNEKPGLFSLVEIALIAYQADADPDALAIAILEKRTELIEGCTHHRITDIFQAIENHKDRLGVKGIEDDFYPYLQNVIEDIRAYASEQNEPTDPEKPPTIPIEPDPETYDPREEHSAHESIPLTERDPITRGK